MNTAPVWRYRVLIRALSPVLAAYTVWRGSRDGGWRYLRERSGWYGNGIPQSQGAAIGELQGNTKAGLNSQNDGSGIRWLHAASVGEVMTALPLIRSLQSTGSGWLLVTTTTPTGAAVLAQQALPRVQHSYLPLDLPGACRRFLKHWQPAHAWIMETEVWPWLFARCSQHDVPLTIVNARLSARTRQHHKGWLAPVYTRALDGVRVLARSQDDASAWLRLGATRSHVSVAGDLKFARNPDERVTAEPVEHPFAGQTMRAFVVAASTHADEEPSLAREWLTRLSEQPSISRSPEASARSANPSASSPDANARPANTSARSADAPARPADASAGATEPLPLLVIAPRHPERAAAIKRELDQLLAEHQGGTAQCARRSQGELPDAQDSLYLADTLGELELFYAHAHAAFIGGSLVPRGGHNMLEAVRAGCPCVVGPHTENFDSVMQPLQLHGGIAVARDVAKVVDFLRRAMTSDASIQQQAACARKAADAHEATLLHYVDALTADQIPEHQNSNTRGC